MRRTPLQQFGDTIGMYAYLAAMGGLRYWQGIRETPIEEQSWPVPLPVAQVERQARPFDYEYEAEREKTPVA